MAKHGSQRIVPRTLKGFRDYLPAAMLPREALIETARRVYRSYGFSPIDTPALEYLEILLGKGGAETDKQLYRFTDSGGREVGLRFDLTVPLARFAAQHIGELGVPFKRYHIATVWRGENTQRGRYREFMQCDFDTIGTTEVAADIETILAVHDVLDAIGLQRFTIAINSRQILTGVLAAVGAQDHSASVLRSLDKLQKVGPAKVQAELVDSVGLSADAAGRILAMAELSGAPAEMLAKLRDQVAGSEPAQAGIERLATVFGAVAAAGVAPERVRLDPSIARGLDYYTGLVLETTLDDLPQIGSVASGGRYDDLAQLYSSQQLPGIGASLGLDRLLAAMEELQLIEAVRTPAEVLVAFFVPERLNDYLRLAARLRAAGLAVEFYPEPKKLGKQLQYADRRGHRVAVIIGPDEFERQECQLKQLTDGSSRTVTIADDGEMLIGQLRELLANC